MAKKRKITLAGKFLLRKLEKVISKTHSDIYFLLISKEKTK